MTEFDGAEGSCFDCPRSLYDAVLLIKPESQRAAALVILRLTYGYYPERTLREGNDIHRATIAKRAGMKLRTAEKAVQQLQRRNIVQQLRPAKPNGDAALLRINPSTNEWLEGTLQGVPYAQERTGGTLRGAPGGTLQGVPTSPSSTNPSSSIPPDDDIENGELEGEILDFEDFWAAFPNAVARKRTHGAWESLTEDQCRMALEAARQMSAAVDAGVKEAQFAPASHRFLADERFDDWRDGPPPGWQARDDGARLMRVIESACSCHLCGQSMDPDEQMDSVDVPGFGLCHESCARERRRVAVRAVP